MPFDHPRHLFRYVADVATTERPAPPAIDLTDDDVARLTAIGHASATLAHDLRNVMTVIVGFTDLLRAEPDLSERGSIHADAIGRAAERGLRLVAEVLEDLNAPAPQCLLVETISSFDPSLGHLVEDHAAFDVSLPVTDGIVPLRVGQLDQIVSNLVVNARDAVALRSARDPESPAPRVVLRVEVAPADDDDCARIVVTDNGVGMDDAVRRRATDFRYTTKQGGQGTGLGLSIVRQLAEAAGGTLAVDSEAGTGTTVTVTLPLL